MFERVCRQKTGRAEYESAVAANYRRLGAAWLTPVELFRPWYGRALARYLLEQRDPAHPLRVFELGGGTGTAALTVLDYLREAAPNVYRTAAYTSVEVSARLADRQRRRLWGGGHADRFTVEERDASDPWPAEHPGPCFVVALEVLDNLPHDRVARPRAEGGAAAAVAGGGWAETVVVEDRAERRGVGGSLREEERPLSGAGRCAFPCFRRHALLCVVFSSSLTSTCGACFSFPRADPLIRRCLGAWEELRAEEEARGGVLRRARRALRGALDRAAGQPEVVFLPTGCLVRRRSLRPGAQRPRRPPSERRERGAAAHTVPPSSTPPPPPPQRLLDTLHKFAPRHRLLLADFDDLPGAQRTGTHSERVLFVCAAPAGGIGTKAAPSPGCLSCAGVQIQGRLAPLVASQVGDGVTRDHATFLLPRGEADIFFPTDFRLLSKLDALAAGGAGSERRRAPGRVVSNREMMGRYAEAEWARTLSGFNPLLDDFTNTRVFLT